MALSSHDELILLRKRARRRLVGALVLVSIATVVLWNVVGHLPEQPMKPESIEIMGAASAPAAASAPQGVKRAASQAAAEMTAAASATELPANLSSITAPTPAEKETVKPPVAQAAASKPKESRPEPKPEAKPKAEPKPEAKPRKADPAAILEGRFDPEPHAAKTDPHGKSIIQLAALSDPAKVDALRAKLAGIGVTAHFSKVDTSKGEVTRVRVGPFASQAEAQSALQKLAKSGINGIIINK
ncbi:SPOR domain-containing protein [Chromobacterium sphagni]|uniref:SPOR domain-containing protein n=1 Tax=Chromobacterium sphagni TaxID=1903179 RepID=A0A1S1WU07_9NEIS|nr:SPOR domain-containing protein [Chromobacterium sphagni]OHX10671.1 hypothetical protein BI347_19295 [Chromobacterium sphagni]OHX19425.1 hypothetical protein BI344_18435 [Chromobacterium sphagni]